MVCAEQDRLNPDVAADTLRDLDKETRARLRALPSNDQILADAIRRSRVVLVESGLPVVLTEFDQSLPETDLATLGEKQQPFMLEWAGLLRNVPVLETAAAGRCLFSLDAGHYRIVRRASVVKQTRCSPK